MYYNKLSNICQLFRESLYTTLLIFYPLCTTVQEFASLSGEFCTKLSTVSSQPVLGLILTILQINYVTDIMATC